MRPGEIPEPDLLRIAFAHFRRRGLRGAALVDIAREAGVQRSGLYATFGSKQELFLRAYGQYKADCLAAVREAMSSGTLPERLHRFLDLGMVGSASGARAGGTAEEAEDLDEAAGPMLAELLTGIAALVEDTLRQGAATGELEGDPAAAAWHLVTVARGLAVLDRALGDAARRRAIAGHAVELVLRPARVARGG